MSENRISRNSNIDTLKAICAFLVVCIHIKFPAFVDFYLSPLYRCAVPIFFMISGYFYSFSWNNERKNKQIEKFLKITVEINLFYLVINCALALLQGSSIKDYLISTVSIKKIILLLVTNDNAISGHLWYLSAILYVVIIFRLFPKLNMLGNKRFIIISILLLCDLLFGKYSLIVLKHNLPLWMSRNFLFVGVAFFWIGNIMREKRKKIKPSICIICMIVFYLTSIGENMLVTKIGMESTRDHGLSTTLLAVLIFWTVIHLKDMRSIFTGIGANYSQNIYYFHPFVISVLEIIFTRGIWVQLINKVGPIVVFVTTLVLLIIVDSIKKSWSK